MIKDFFDKIKATKKLANERNVHNWHNCVFHSMILILGASLILSLYTLIYLSDISLDTTLGELLISLQPGIMLPLFYSLLLSYLFLEKLIILHIYIFEKMNKQIFKFWQKLDMYWFKKYKKSSPLTEGLSKIQSKASKYQGRFSKKQKKLITLGIIILLLTVQIAWRVPTLIETFDDEEELSPEQQKELQELEEYERSRIIIHGGG